jgi:hypothetical protein
VQISTLKNNPYKGIFQEYAENEFFFSYTSSSSRALASRVLPLAVLRPWPTVAPPLAVGPSPSRTTSGAWPRRSRVVVVRRQPPPRLRAIAAGSAFPLVGMVRLVLLSSSPPRGIASAHVRPPPLPPSAASSHTTSSSMCAQS